ncbi:AFR552Cp [Eremothecium gossypii ATCC 10895]|uniref:AFR552Cp n=1 Tax=Eremothecium gossypii (strain ATCC 10895 / CBS 109.51 / FGSC 9923 / NRRL Y-1056) TaxID=284811 RepID=Q752M2_EREGS|nr:AFR552Cp [Eremothecium gossypii ATCC 10895]AAS53923.2 AFR552Cp [Eremothecium gossypii ATCC 10895]
MNLANEPKFQIQVDETEDTEWNDILRQHGVIPERPPSPTAQLEEALEEVLQRQHENRLENKDLSELEELEDEEDDEFLEFYKRKRMAEMQKQQRSAKYGDVYHINKPEYNDEITECSKQGEGVYVFVHLSSEGKLQSRLLSSLFQQAARKFPQVKFVEILANRAIENYPESNAPTLLVYYKGDVVKNLVTLLELGGNSSTLQDLEGLLIKVGAVAQNDNRLLINQDDEESMAERQLRYSNTKGVRSGISRRFDVGARYDADDEHDDFFD